MSQMTGCLGVGVGMKVGWGFGLGFGFWFGLELGVRQRCAPRSALVIPRIAMPMPMARARTRTLAKTTALAAECSSTAPSRPTLARVRLTLRKG